MGHYDYFYFESHIHNLRMLSLVWGGCSWTEVVFLVNGWCFVVRGYHLLLEYITQDSSPNMHLLDLVWSPFSLINLVVLCICQDYRVQFLYYLICTWVYLLGFWVSVKPHKRLRWIWILTWFPWWYKVIKYFIMWVWGSV